MKGGTEARREWGRQGGREAQSPSPEWGKRDLGREPLTPAGRKGGGGGSWPRGGGSRGPSTLCSEPFPVLPGSPPPGWVTHLEKGRRQGCVQRGRWPVKAPPLALLLQEGGLGWADF